VNQFPFGPLVVVRIINIHFSIYSVTAPVRLSTVLKIEVHRASTNNDVSKMFERNHYHAQ